jgi:MFS family permease
MLRALRHRNYRLLFFGQLISLCGLWMQNTAQGWLVLRLTDSPFWLGLIAAAQSLPVLLFSLPAGALADRMPKRLVLLVTQ